jgi:hypothetical protein
MLITHFLTHKCAQSVCVCAEFVFILSGLPAEEEGKECNVETIHCHCRKDPRGIPDAGNMSCEQHV